MFSLGQQFKLQFNVICFGLLNAFACGHWSHYCLSLTTKLPITKVCLLTGCVTEYKEICFEFDWVGGELGLSLNTAFSEPSPSCPGVQLVLLCRKTATGVTLSGSALAKVAWLTNRIHGGELLIQTIHTASPPKLLRLNLLDVPLSLIEVEE